MTDTPAPAEKEPLRWPTIRETGLRRVIVGGEAIDILWHDARPAHWDDTQLGECDGEKMEIHLLSRLTARKQWLILAHEMWHCLEYKRDWNDASRVSERNAWGFAEARVASIELAHALSPNGLTPADVRRHLELL